MFQVVQLVLSIFRDRIIREPVVLMSDNATVVEYIKKQGGTVSQVM